MTTLHTDSKARAAIAAAIARAQKAAKNPLSVTELRSIELATLRDIAKRELAAKNAAVSLAAKEKADAERLAKLQARAKYELATLRDAVAVEYAAIFSSVTGGTDSQAYCRKVVHTVHETVSRTIAVCDNKINEFLREAAANTVPATDTAATDTAATDTAATDTAATDTAATDTIVVTGKGIAFAPIVKAVGGYIAQVFGRFYHVTKEGFAPVFSDGVAVRDTRGLARYLSAV